MSNTAGFRKMYLVDPKQISEVEPPADQQLKEQATKSIETRINLLDKEMEKILLNKELNDEEKLRRYLETLRKYIINMKNLQQLSNEPVPVRIVNEPYSLSTTMTSQPTKVTSATSPIPAAKRKDVTQQTERQAKKHMSQQTDIAPLQVPMPAAIPSTSKAAIEIAKEVREIPSPLSPAVSTFADFSSADEIPYSNEKIIEHMPDKKKSHVRNLLKEIERKGSQLKYLDWDKTTGRLIVDGKNIQDSNIITNLHILMDNRKAPKTQPESYALFAGLLEKAKIIRPEARERIGSGKQEIKWIGY